MNMTLTSLSSFNKTIRLKTARDSSAVRYMIRHPELFRQHISDAVWNLYQKAVKTYPLPQ